MPYVIRVSSSAGNLQEYCRRDDHFFYRKWYSNGRYGLVQEPLKGEYYDEPLVLTANNPYLGGTYPRPSVITEETYQRRTQALAASVAHLPPPPAPGAPSDAYKDENHSRSNGEIYKNHDLDGRYRHFADTTRARTRRRFVCFVCGSSSKFVL